jgi:cytochrome c oxidase accessory protein FixG
MLDEFGQRVAIIPAEVRGRFQRRKEKVHFFLLVLFLILPWVRVGGHQAIHLDIPGRRFTFFGLELFAYDIPLLFLVLLIFAGTLFLLTALYGRVWCGWGCPQTVFIEAVYRRIERWVEGTYIERRKLAQAELSFKKLFKFFLKWALFFAVSSFFAHSFIAYFAGGRELFEMMQRAPKDNSTYFIFVSFVTGLLLFDFGWFREQFCVIMCPYGRFQSVLQDTQSLTILYDAGRGEPRKSPETKNPGDCVSCKRCVEVCPTGIDIRNGTQLECIGCTACIDACDEIMLKVHKPTGLIAYRTEASLTSDVPLKPIWQRPRVIAYGTVLVIAALVLSYLLSSHEPIFVEVLRAQGLPYELIHTQGQELVQNQFKIRLQNHELSAAKITVTWPETAAIHHITLPMSEILLPPDSRIEIPIIVQTDASGFDSTNQLNLNLRVSEVLPRHESSDQTSRPIKTLHVTLLGPAQKKDSTKKDEL